MSKKSSKKGNNKPFLAAMIGTGLEYYDASLYGFLAPILTPIFLPTLSPTVALILAYALYPLGIITRPLGAILIGRLGDRLGRKRALILSLTGTAIATGLIGLLPTFASIGFLAPLGIVFLKVVQNFFVAGEYNGGAIFTLEHAKGFKGFKSGLYCAFTVSGILVAALVATIVAYLPQGYWRLAFLLSFVTGLFGVFLRKKVPESPEFSQSQSLGVPKKVSFLTYFRDYRFNAICVIAVSIFFAALYQILSAFLIAFVPLVSPLTHETMLLINTIGLTLYMVCLPVFGIVADKLGFQKSMLYAALTCLGLAYPLFLLVDFPSLFNICILKFTLSVLCAWYVSPFHAWVQELFPVNARYQMISLTYSIGSQIGSSTPAVVLWCWKLSSYNQIPAFFLVAWSLFAIGALLKAKAISSSGVSIPRESVT